MAIDFSKYQVGGAKPQPVQTPQQPKATGSINFDKYRVSAPTQPQAPVVQPPAPTQTFTQKLQQAGGFISGATEKIKDFISPNRIKTPPVKLPTSGNFVTLTPPKVTLEPMTAQQAPSAQITTQARQKYLKPDDFWSIEATEQRKKKINDEVVAAAREVRPGYKEPGVWGSVIESIKENTVGMVSGLGATTEMVGNMTQLIGLTKAGQKMQLNAEKTLASNPEWREEKDAPWDVKKVARIVAGATPSLLGTIGATLVGSLAGPVGGAVSGLSFAFSMEAGSTYKEALQAGKSEEEARTYGLAVGTVNAILEKIFPSKLLDKKKIVKDIGKNISKKATKETIEKVSKSLVNKLIEKAGSFGIKFTKNGTLEGGTESLEQLWSNVIATSYDKDRKLWDNLLESFVGGFGSGAVTGAVLPDGEYTPDDVINKVVTTDLKNTEDGKALIKAALEAKNQGLNIQISGKEEPVAISKEKEEEKKITPKISIENLDKEDLSLYGKDTGAVGRGFFGGEFGKGIELAKKAPKELDQVGVLAQASKNIAVRRDARMVTYLLSNRVNDETRVARLLDFKNKLESAGTPEGNVISNAIDKLTSDQSGKPLSPTDRGEVIPVVPVAKQQPDLSKVTSEKDKQDYETILKPKIDALPETKPNEVVVIQTGTGEYVDTQIDEALSRGVNENTKVMVVNKNDLSLTDNNEKNLRGERLLKTPTTEIKQTTKQDPLKALKTEARKYKSAEEFFLRMTDSTRDGLRNKGIRGREAIEDYWNSSAKQFVGKPKIEDLNPTGGLLVDYDPKSRMTMELGKNITTLDKTMKVSPDEMITIYRGAPKNQKSINPGDFITTNYDLAKSYTGDGNVLSLKVKAKDVLDDITEPLGDEYIYRPTQATAEKKQSKPEVKKPAKKKTPDSDNKFTSRVFERLQEENKDLTGELLVDRVRLQEDAEKAVDLIAKDKQKAYRIAMGEEKSDAITSTATNIALAEEALREGNTKLYADLVKNRSIAQTRRGQEISAERGSITDNSTSRYVKELLSIRLENVGRSYLKDLQPGKATNKEKANNVIDRKVAAFEKKVKANKIDVKTALKLLDEITCI